VLAEQILTGNKRAMARLITQLENRLPSAAVELVELYRHTGKAWVVGITGAPGTGKSTLVSELAKAYRQRGQTVAILAVDPTSPFSGGAVLGDRIRMRDLAGDAGVFIRSMATRGSLGGLAVAANDTIKVLDAAGYEIILVETVGAGQSEVDIVRTAPTVLVVEAPGLGDGIQTIKAGILEIADIFVVNKADHNGVELTVSNLKRMLELGHATPEELRHHHLTPTLSDQVTPHLNRRGNGGEVQPAHWQIPIVKTVALKGTGMAELLAAIDQHRHYSQQSGQLELRQLSHSSHELMTMLQEALLARLLQEIPPPKFNALVQQVAARELSPQEAVRLLLE